MNITVVGSGYVGLVAAVCFADAGHKVDCIDNNLEKINSLKQGIIPIYEPGLKDLLNYSKTRINFSTDIQSSIINNDIIFIAVGTPSLEDGNADLGPTYSVVDEICKYANKKKFVVLKSTVPIGTAKILTDYCKNKTKHEIEIVNNPEFLKEGTAVDDFLRPDRVVIGCSSHEAKKILWEIYEPFLKNGNPIFFMDNTSAEVTKYAANAFLSVKISFINELALLADKVGADINEVRKGFTSDHRINPSFFYPGLGYGGSCFPKDVKALIQAAKNNDLNVDVVSAADKTNEKQKVLMAYKIKDYFKSLEGKTIAIWGLSFKPRTDDVREAPAKYIIEKLISFGAKVKGYDPVANDNAKIFFPKELEVTSSAIEAAKGANALLIATEWNEFKNPNFESLKDSLIEPNIFDGRNIYDPLKIKQLGFNYFCIGRQRV